METRKEEVHSRRSTKNTKETSPQLRASGSASMCLHAATIAPAPLGSDLRKTRVPPLFPALSLGVVIALLSSSLSLRPSLTAYLTGTIGQHVQTNVHTAPLPVYTPVGMRFPFPTLLLRNRFFHSFLGSHYACHRMCLPWKRPLARETKETAEACTF